MTTPAATTILTEIGTRLANITTANGYNVTVKKIERARLKPFTGYDLPSVNYWATQIGNERTVYDDDNRTLDLYIEIHDLTRDDPFIDIANKLIADVVTSLIRKDTAPKVSDDPDYELTETVSDLIFDSAAYEIGQGQDPWCGALVKFTIKYRTEPFNMTAYGP